MDEEKKNPVPKPEVSNPVKKPTKEGKKGYKETTRLAFKPHNRVPNLSGIPTVLKRMKVYFVDFGMSFLFLRQWSIPPLRRTFTKRAYGNELLDRYMLSEGMMRPLALTTAKAKVSALDDTEQRVDYDSIKAYRMGDFPVCDWWAGCSSSIFGPFEDRGTCFQPQSPMLDIETCLTYVFMQTQYDPTALSLIAGYQPPIQQSIYCTNNVQAPAGAVINWYANLPANVWPEMWPLCRLAMRPPPAPATQDILLIGCRESGGMCYPDFLNLGRHQSNNSDFNVFKQLADKLSVELDSYFQTNNITVTIDFFDNNGNPTQRDVAAPLVTCTDGCPTFDEFMNMSPVAKPWDSLHNEDTVTRPLYYDVNLMLPNGMEIPPRIKGIMDLISYIRENAVFLAGWTPPLANRDPFVQALPHYAVQLPVALRDLFRHAGIIEINLNPKQISAAVAHWLIRYEGGTELDIHKATYNISKVRVESSVASPFKLSVNNVPGFAVLSDFGLSQTAAVLKYILNEDAHFSQNVKGRLMSHKTEFQTENWEMAVRDFLNSIFPNKV